MELGTWNDLLNEIARSALNPDRRAICINFICENRISEKRQHRLEAYLKQALSEVTFTEFSKGIRNYFREKICLRTLPEFVYDEWNHDNILAGHHRGPRRLSPKTELAHILDLNGLVAIYEWGKYRRFMEPVFHDFPLSPNPSNVQRWLCTKLNGDEQVAKNLDFVDATFLLLDEFRREGSDGSPSPYQPVWVTAWEYFGKIMTKYPDAPENWLSRLGIPKEGERWIVVLRYPAAKAGTICRPTQIDAGWFAWHFPSPGFLSPSRGGHPMDLSTSSRSMFPEFIHPQRTNHRAKGDKNNHVFAIRKVGLPIGFDPLRLESAREFHWEILRDQYGTDVENWMKVPV